MAKLYGRVVHWSWFAGVLAGVFTAAAAGGCDPESKARLECPYESCETESGELLSCANDGDCGNQYYCLEKGGSGERHDPDSDSPGVCAKLVLDDAGADDVATDDAATDDAATDDAATDDAATDDAATDDAATDDAATDDAATDDAGAGDEIVCVDPEGDFRDSCGPEVGLEGPPALDVLGGSLTAGDGGSIVAEIVLAGDAQTYWEDQGERPVISVVIQLDTDEWVECSVESDGSCDLSSGPDGVTGSGEWADVDTYVITFDGFALDAVVQVNFNTTFFNGDESYCDTCQWPPD